MNTPEKQLSESLFAACKAAGIYNPRYIAQDKDEPYVWHYDLMPDTEESGVWAVDNGNAIKIHHPPYAGDWQESLLEWVEPQGEPLADVLARHTDHVADTSKMIDDDARKLGYRKMIAEYAGRRTEAQVYERAWQDALAWKAMAEKGGAGDIQ